MTKKPTNPKYKYEFSCRSEEEKEVMQKLVREMTIDGSRAYDVIMNALKLYKEKKK